MILSVVVSVIVNDVRLYVLNLLATLHNLMGFRVHIVKIL